MGRVHTSYTPLGECRGVQSFCIMLMGIFEIFDDFVNCTLKP